MLDSRDARHLGFGGWTLSAMHQLSLEEGILERGDGGRATGGVIPNMEMVMDQQSGYTDTLFAVAEDSTIYTVVGTSIYKVLPDRTDELVIAGSASCTTASATANALCVPTAIAAGADGMLYVADQDRENSRRIARILRINPRTLEVERIAGDVTTTSLGSNGTALSAQFGKICALEPSADGYLVASDCVRNVLLRIGPDGYLQRIAGNGTASGGSLTHADATQVPINVSNVNDFAIDAEGGVVFADSDRSHCALRRVAPSGAISVVAQQGSCDHRFFWNDMAVDGDRFFFSNYTQELREGNYLDRNIDLHLLGPRDVHGCGALDIRPQQSTTGFGMTFELGPDGHLYVAEGCGTWVLGNVRIRRVRVDALGRFGITTYVSADRSELFEFDESGRHIATRHPLTGGFLRTFEYDEAGLLEAIEDGDGNRTTIERDMEGIATAIVAPFGQRTELDYDSEGFLDYIEVSTADEPHEFLYDADGLMQEQEDPRGELHEYDYDADGRITRSEDSLGGYWNFVRTTGPGYTRVTKTTAEGRSTVYEQTRGLGTNTFTVRLPTYTGSPAGANQNVRTVYSDGTAVTTMADGRVITATPSPDPVFGASALLWNETVTNGQYTKVRSMTRSASLAFATNPLSLTSMTETATENAHTTTRTYTASTKTWATTSAGGRDSTVVLDDLGRVVSSQTEGTLPVEIGYDENGRVETVEQGARLASYDYDETSGFLEFYTDAEENITEYVPDDIGRVMSVETDSETTSFDYDDESHLTSVTPPDRTSHGLGYTDVDLFEEYQAPQVGVSPTITSYGYNLDRQLTDVTQPDASEIIYDYFANGRLEFITVPGATTYTYAYNNFDNVSAITSSARDGSMSFSYGGSRNRGTLPSRIDTSGAHAVPSVWTGTTIGVGSLNGIAWYAYDGAFNPYHVEVWGATSQVRGFAAFYTRDADELVTSITPAFANTGVRSFWLQRSALDGHVSGTCIGGTSYTNCMSSTPRVSTAYDVDVDAMTPGTGDLEGITASIGATEVYDVVYERDDLGRIARIDETIQSTTTTRKYEYDARGRLIRVRDDNDDIVSEYEYDGNGARTRALTPAGEVELGTDLGCGVSLDAPVDAQDRLCRYGDYEYVYDDNGRLSTKTQISTSDETVYTYDGLGRLRRVVLPDATQIDYVHDALGRRIGKVVDGNLEKGWLYGTDPLRPLAQRDDDGQIEMTFVYETRVNVPDYIVDLEAPSKTYRVITDHLGSVRLVINVATGSVVQRLDYDEFGNVLNDTNPGFQPFGFAGGLYDADTGLVRFGARDYDALTGRWTAKDPIGFGGGDTNVYSYVGNDAVNASDPSGLIAPFVACLALAAGAGAGGVLGAAYGDSVGDVLIGTGTGFLTVAGILTGTIPYAGALLGGTATVAGGAYTLGTKGVGPAGMSAAAGYSAGQTCEVFVPGPQGPWSEYMCGTVGDVVGETAEDLMSGGDQ